MADYRLFCHNITIEHTISEIHSEVQKHGASFSCRLLLMHALMSTNIAILSCCSCTWCHRTFRLDQCSIPLCRIWICLFSVNDIIHSNGCLWAPWVQNINPISQVKWTLEGIEDIALMSSIPLSFNTLRPRQNGRRFADDTFKRIFVNENVIISIEISPKFVRTGPTDNFPSLVQIMAWRRPGD